MRPGQVCAAASVAAGAVATALFAGAPGSGRAFFSWNEACSDPRLP